MQTNVSKEIDVFYRQKFENENIAPKTCPFCGSEAYIVKKFDWSVTPPYPMWWVECPNFGCCSRPGMGDAIQKKKPLDCGTLDINKNYL